LNRIRCLITRGGEGGGESERRWEEEDDEEKEERLWWWWVAPKKESTYPALFGFPKTTARVALADPHVPNPKDKSRELSDDGMTVTLIENHCPTRTWKGSSSADEGGRFRAVRASVDLVDVHRSGSWCSSDEIYLPSIT